jgi:hypothetical protein
VSAAAALFYGLVAGLLGLAIGLPLVRRSRRETALARWARGAYGLLTGGDDFGRLGREEAQGLLEAPWGIEDAAQLRDAVAGLERTESGNEAWDLVRAIVLARLGAAAGYLDEQESWEIVARAAARLQGSYGSWAALGEAYAEGRSAWLRGQGISQPAHHSPVERNIEALRARVWPRVAFRGRS